MSPFTTLKARIMLLVLVVIFILAGSLLLLSSRAIQNVTYASEQKAARNSVSLLLLNVENQYKGLLYNSNMVLDLRKKEMKDLAKVVLDLSEGFHQRAVSGALSESRAKEMALEQIKTFRYGNNDYFFVYDENYVAVAHPDPLFMGRELKNYRDAKGKKIVQELMNVSQMPEGGYSEYYWKRLNRSQPVRKIGYAVFYRPWKWMIGTGVYVDDIDEEYQRKLKAILAELRSTLSSVSRDTHSEFFLFNGKGQLITSSQIDPAGGQVPLKELMRPQATTTLPFRYRAADGRWKQAYVGYFQPLDWHLARILDEDELLQPGRMLVEKALLLLGLLSLASVIVASLLANRIAHPITRLTENATNLAANEFKPQPVMEELAARRDEVGKLAAAFSYMQRTLQQYLLHLRETTAAKERIDSELRIAREIQMSMLPRRSTDAGPDSVFDVVGLLEPARDVGGDFYDYFYTDDTHLCLVIGDVCDKGVPASLFMAVSKTLIRATTTIIRTYAKEGVSPEEVLSRVNLELNRDNPARMFVTIFLGIVDLATGEFEYANAGHNAPYRIGREDVIALDDLRATPAGARKTAIYNKSHIMLQPGDLLLLYTDGLTEARNSAGQLFTQPRLRECLSNGTSRSAPLLAQQLMEKVASWRGSAAPADDITLLAFEFRRLHDANHR